MISCFSFVALLIRSARLPCTIRWLMMGRYCRSSSVACFHAASYRRFSSGLSSLCTVLYRMLGKCQQRRLVGFERECAAPQQRPHKCTDCHIRTDTFLLIKRFDLKAVPGETDDKTARVHPLFTENIRPAGTKFAKDLLLDRTVIINGIRIFSGIIRLQIRGISFWFSR